jgi:outer membrane murein-binding lipoprotein Lpp
MVRFGSLGSAALAIVLAVVVCAGCGSSGSSKVSAGTYVSTVCSAISPLERDVVTRSSALNSTTAPNATQAKKALQGFLVAVEGDAARALSKVQAAGTPDISNGKTVAGTVLKTFTELRDTLRAAVTKSSSLPTDSPSSFKTAAQALGASVRNSLNGIDSSGLTNPDLQKAAAGQPACKSLANS